MTDDPVEVLTRWEAAGAHWRVLSQVSGRLTIGLFTCDGGEEVSRLTSRAASLRAYVDDRSDSSD